MRIGRSGPVAALATSLWLASLAAAALTPNERISASAKEASPGTYARSWSGEPLYWTVVGAPGSGHAALLSEDGALEPMKGGYSIEPFVWVDSARIAARDTARTRTLEQGELPIPSVAWAHPLAQLRVRAFAPDDDAVLASYRVENPDRSRHRVELWLALRPMQVLPTWQFLNLEPGFAAIRDVRSDREVVRVNGADALWPLSRPDLAGAARGDLRDPLEHFEIPGAREARDDGGFCGAVLAWRWTLEPGASREVHVRVALHVGVTPVATGTDDGAFVSDALARAVEAWRSQQGRVEVALPREAADVAHTLRTAMSHILVNRDGPRLRPGARNYARTWIRDGAQIASALSLLGRADVARAFLDWYAGFQQSDGSMPCCIDERGVDSTPEHDSIGAFLTALATYARATRDALFVQALWPRVVGAISRLDALRMQQRNPRWRTELGGAAFGILPESISHEGYSKKPVHSYWDDLFARQGLRDAVWLAGLVGDAEHAEAWSRTRDEFDRDLRASFAAVMEQRGIDYLPGSVELADFDPAATAVGLQLGGEARDDPEPALQATFARYVHELEQVSRGAAKRESFTPYELRIADALIRMGKRDEAWDVLDFQLAGRRPAGWNQWPEIVWTDETRGRWLGDMPHGWVAATFLLTLRTALAYERASDRALVVAAGVPARWLASGEPVRVTRLPTWWGPLDYEIRRTASGSMDVHIAGGLSLPPGGVVVAPPGVEPVTLRTLPATTRIPPESRALGSLPSGRREAHR